MAADLVAFLKARLDEDDYWANTRKRRPANAPDDPGRVLREVEAKRRLLEQFTLRGDSVRATVQPATGGVWDDLLRILAAIYSDHPDYRDEWKP